MNEEIIYGTLLGDGYIAKLDNKYAVYYRFEIEHSIEDIDYINWLQDNLRDVLPYRRERNRKFKTKDGEIKSRTIHLYGKTNKDFEELRFFIYKDGVKTVSKEWLDKLTPLSLAVWYMDDGSYHINTNVIEISTDSFTLDEHKLMQDYFREKWGISVSIIGKGRSYRLYFPKLEAVKFLTLIFPHIAPGMERKAPRGWELARKLPPNFHKRLSRSNTKEKCREIITQNIKEFCEKHDISEGFPVVEYNYSPDSFSYKAIQYAFGGWEDALKEVGIPYKFI